MKNVKLSELLSFHIYDDGDFYPEINTKELIKNTLVESPLNDWIKLHDEWHWDHEAAEKIAKHFGLKVIGQENTYNYENDLSDIMQYSIVSSDEDWVYADKTFIIISMHQGGDARGNYSKAVIYEWHGEDSLSFLDHSIGYYFRDIEDNEAIQEAEPGHSDNPTYELNKEHKVIIEDSGQVLAIDKEGNEYVGHAYHGADQFSSCKKYVVLDWAGNNVGSPEFNHYDDASDWITETIDRVYGDLSDDEHDEHRQEYVIHDITSDEDIAG